MKIPLRQFEQHISETILKRGLSYFKNGHVQEPEEITSGQYEAKVQGTEVYTVWIRIQHETVVEAVCDCPYDMGSVCKHIAAVLFYLQQEELGITRTVKKKSKKPPVSKKKTVEQKVDALLEKITPEELKQFVRTQTLSDSAFRQTVLLQFGHTIEKESAAFYVKQLKMILRKAAGRKGYIDYYAAPAVGRSVRELLQRARQKMDTGNLQSVLFISTAVLEVMTEALQNVDDSDGEIGSVIEDAMDLLYEIASSEIPEDIRRQLFDYTVSAYEKEIFSGWDWHLSMLDIASRICTGKKEAEKIMAHLDAIVQEPFDYTYNSAQEIKLSIILKTEGEKAAARFAEQNISNPAFRHQAIQSAVTKKEFEKAIAFAREGVDQDKKDKPGLAADWYMWLLHIAKEQKRADEIVSYARLLLLEYRRDFQHCFSLLHKHVPAKKWNSFLEQLIEDVQKSNRGHAFDVLTRIYIEEHDWTELLKYLQKCFVQGVINMEYLPHYEQYLAAEYPAELAEMYARGVQRALEYSKDRKAYKHMCQYIRRMLKLGERDRARELIAYLQSTYPQRRALMEELENL